MCYDVSLIRNDDHGPRSFDGPPASRSVFWQRPPPHAHFMLRVRLGTFQRPECDIAEMFPCRSALNRTRRLMLTRSDLTIVMKDTVTVRPLPPVLVRRFEWQCLCPLHHCHLSHTFTQPARCLISETDR
jgi:hypothetical protein